MHGHRGSRAVQGQQDLVPPAPNPMSEPARQQPTRSDRITFSILLTRWVQFAQSALALGETGSQGLVKESVCDVIMLQAITYSLQHLDELDPRERALGIDRAEVLCEKHTRSLRLRWARDRMPPQLREILAEARARVEFSTRAASAGGTGKPP